MSYTTEDQTALAQGVNDLRSNAEVRRDARNRQNTWTSQRRRLNRLAEAIGTATDPHTLRSIARQAGQIKAHWDLIGYPDWWSLADRVEDDALTKLRFGLKGL